MALDRGERGYRGDHFSRGGGPRDRREHDEEPDREYFGSTEYNEEYPDYPPPPERRHWRGNDYRVSQDSPDRGRSYQRDDDDRERFIDTRHRGFLRGESAGRYGRQNEWMPGEGRPREPFGDPDRWTGPYAGRGPKGYRRSDERVHEDICERLSEHPSIDASDIEVSVHDGEVTLSGRVESRAIKHLTEAMTETVSGVKEVHNQLRVWTQESGTGSRL
jgi:hypothetical protein